MKTTVEIPDPLMTQLRERARAEGTTIRALLETVLRRWLEEQGTPAPFRLADRRFGEGGLRPEFAGAGWEAIREATYEGRGA